MKPQATGPSLRLALAACPYPGGVADRTPHPQSHNRPELELTFMPRPGPADAGRRRLLEWIEGSSVPTIQVWTGDNIYIDATAGLFDPALASTAGAPGKRGQARALPDALVRAYAAMNANLFVGPPMARVKAIDDHEIVDNWEPSLDPDRRKADYRQLNVGRRAFVAAVRNGRLGARATKEAPVPLWQRRLEQGLPLFVCDTRTERRPRTPGSLHKAHMMSPDQFAELLAWLEPTEAEDGRDAYLRVMVSPSILLPRRLATSERPEAAWRSDAWDGFPATFHALLAAIADRPRLRLLALSGDEHRPCVVSARLQRAGQSAPGAELLSVHTGAMYAPYPFANARPEDFADEPFFDFPCPGAGYRCRIEAVCHPVSPGDGFVGIEFDDRRWPSRIDWLRADGGVQPLWSSRAPSAS